MRRVFRLQPGRNREVNRLVRALSHQELVDDGETGVVDYAAETRAEALLALAELGEVADGHVTEAVAERLDDPVPFVRQVAVRALSALDATRARDELIRGVVSWPEPPYGEARMEALRALQELDDASVAERVIQAVASSNGSAVLDGITRSAIVYLASDPERGARPAETVGLLIDMLRRADGNRRNLEILLAWLGEHSVDELIDGLDDPALRESAATVLGALRESRAVPGLVRCLEDERVHVRLASARALGEIRDVRGVEGLIRAVSDPDYEVRRVAQEALDALGTVGVVAGVSAVLQLVMKDGPQGLPKPKED
jgi:HEAT repeat protein